MTHTPKELIFDEKAREEIVSGIDQLAKAIAFTLGPKGRNVGMEKSYGAPIVTNDGNQVIQELELKSSSENVGVSLGKEVAEKINESCGDGTTTGILLLRSLVDEGMKLISAGASPIDVKRGIEKCVETIVQEIKTGAIQIQSRDDIYNIASVSASGNEEIGNFIADAFEKVGSDGVITIEEAKSMETTLEVVEGMQFDRGYLSPYFCTDPVKLTLTFENPLIALIDKKITNIHELLPTLQAALSLGKPLVILAEEIEGDALSTLVMNKLRGTIQVAAIKAPGFGDRRKAILSDIAALTGATVISEEAGMDLQKVDATLFGTCSRLDTTKDHTTIIGGAGNEKAIQSQIKQIEREITQASSNYDKEKLEERKAKLGGGVAVIRVGASTEPELKLKKQDFEDSLNATKAALDQGVAIGGGVAFLRARTTLTKLNLGKEEEAGKKVLFKALATPHKQIAINSGLDGSVIVAETERAKCETFGLNAKTGKLEDLKKAKIFDPVKVLISALQHAASAATMILITNALILEAPEETEE